MILVCTILGTPLESFEMARLPNGSKTTRTPAEVVQLAPQLAPSGRPDRQPHAAVRFVVLPVEHGAFGAERLAKLTPRNVQL